MLFYQPCDSIIEASFHTFHHPSSSWGLFLSFFLHFFFFLAVAVTELQHPLWGKRLPTESFLCSDFSQRTHEAYFVATYGQGGMHIFLKLCTFKTGNCVTSAALFFFFFPLRVEWHLAFQLVPKAWCSCAAPQSAAVFLYHVLLSFTEEGEWYQLFQALPSYIFLADYFPSHAQYRKPWDIVYKVLLLFSTAILSMKRRVNYSISVSVSGTTWFMHLSLRKHVLLWCLLF